MARFAGGNPLRKMMMGGGGRGGRPLGTRQGQGFNPQPQQVINPQLKPMMKSAGFQGAMSGGSGKPPVGIETGGYTGGPAVENILAGGFQQKPGVPGIPPSGPSGSISGGGLATQTYTPGGQAGSILGGVNRMGGIGLPQQQPPMQMGSGGMLPPQQQQPGQPQQQVPEWYRNRGRFGGGGRGYGGGY